MKKPPFKIKKYIIMACCVLAVLLTQLCIFLHGENNRIKITEYTYASSIISEGLSQCKALVISDLHNKKFSKNNKALFRAIDKADPDVIFITGDLIDGRRKNFKKVESFLEGIKDTCPIYFVNGNHEYYLDDEEYQRYSEILSKNGVIKLCNESLEIQLGEQTINLVGIDDFQGVYLQDKDSYRRINSDEIIDVYAKHDSNTALQLYSKEQLNIILCHRPDMFDYYNTDSHSIILSGHSHGGQVNLPLIQPWINKNFLKGLSKYLGGAWKNGNTCLYVSRGIGNSLFPFRINNNPELVVLNFKAE